MPESAAALIHGGMAMREILRIMPGAQRALFKGFHLGGCSACGFSPEESLNVVCSRNDGIPVDEVIAYLERAHDADKEMLISPNDLKSAMECGIPCKLVDIRTREEYDAVKIPQSYFFTEELMSTIQSFWPREDLLVLVDHTGTRSLDAAAYFAGHGFTNVKGLMGGIDAFSAEVDRSIPRYVTE